MFYFLPKPHWNYNNGSIITNSQGQRIGDEAVAEGFK